MEYRYVYRKVEDGIGAPLQIPKSLHSSLTEELRYQYREGRDLAQRLNMAALCLAPTLGSSEVNMDKVYDTVVQFQDKAFYRKVPYLEPKEEKILSAPAPQEINYEEEFKYIQEEENKKRQQQKALDKAI